MPQPVPSWKPTPAAPGPAWKPATAATAADDPAGSCCAGPTAAEVPSAAADAAAGAASGGGVMAGFLVARTDLKPPAGLLSSLAAAAAAAAWAALAAAACGVAPAAGPACCRGWNVGAGGWALCAALGALKGFAYLEGRAGLRKAGWWARGCCAEAAMLTLWRCCRGAGACHAAAGLGVACGAARAFC